MAKVRAWPNFDVMRASMISILTNLSLEDNFNFRLNNSKVPAAIYHVEHSGSISTSSAWLGGQGLVQPAPGKVTWMAIDAASADTGDGLVEIVVNGADDSSNLAALATPDSNNSYEVAICDLKFQAGDRLMPVTTATPTGTNSNWRCSFAVIFD